QAVVDQIDVVTFGADGGNVRDSGIVGPSFIPGGAGKVCPVRRQGLVQVPQVRHVYTARPHVSHLQHHVLHELALNVQVPFLDIGRGIMEVGCARTTTDIGVADVR